MLLFALPNRFQLFFPFQTDWTDGQILERVAGISDIGVDAVGGIDNRGGVENRIEHWVVARAWGPTV
jgi:hypothetical protein